MTLNPSIAELLSEPGRDWTPRAGAAENVIAELIRLAPFELPQEYIELLRYCDGGFGDLNLPPLLFALYEIAESVEYNEALVGEGDYSKFWFIGGNGGLEQIALDLRRGPPWPIVMIDPIAGPESAVTIASDMAEFVTAIGIAADDSPAN